MALPSPVLMGSSVWGLSVPLQAVQRVAEIKAYKNNFIANSVDESGKNSIWEMVNGKRRYKNLQRGFDLPVFFYCFTTAYRLTTAIPYSSSRRLSP
jgi:hypothetical protein